VFWHRTCFQEPTIHDEQENLAMPENTGKDWRQLCADAAQEPDSEKLFLLVHQILDAIDEDEYKARERQSNRH
jgi:hypothetical protein